MASRDVASFSSRGPSLRNGGIQKPDVVGAGVDISAAWHKQVGPNPTGSPDTAFIFASGCSMATLVLAGIIALLKSAHPNWSPAMIKSAIMTTAGTLGGEGLPIADEKSNTYDSASFFTMGAGHVNPSNANEPGLVYDIQPDEYIAYFCGLKLSNWKIQAIIRHPIKCSTIQKLEPEQFNYPSISVQLDTKPTTKINRTLTNIGIEKSVYTVEVDAPDGVTVQVHPKTLSFTKLNAKEKFHCEV